MYSRQNGRRDREISIPQNYSGNAFSDIRDGISEAGFDGDPSDISDADHSTEASLPNREQPRKGFLPINIGSEELIIIGIALLLFQSDDGDGIVPLLLAILLLG